MLNIIISFDYELFFNDMYASEEQILINPTNQILEMLKNNNVNATFFVDTTCITKYIDLGLNCFPIMASNQIKRIFELGNDLQLHLHPIWDKSYYENEKWHFNQDFYTFSNFSDIEIQKIIQKGKNYLIQTISNDNYKCVAYRAGGFCLKSNRNIIKYLLDEGIFIDSSVLKYSVNKSINQPYDYRKVPEYDNWFYTKSFDYVKNAISDSIYEVPIGSIKRIPKKWIVTKKHKLLSDYKPLGKQSQIDDNSTNLKKVRNRIKGIFAPVQLNGDQLHYKSLNLIVDEYLNKLKNNQDIFISLISHPKYQTLKTINNLENFINHCKNNENIRFVTMRDIYDNKIVLEKYNEKED
mgnify:CR=1 FL=1